MLRICGLAGVVALGWRTRRGRRIDVGVKVLSASERCSLAGVARRIRMVRAGRFLVMFLRRCVRAKGDIASERTASVSEFQMDLANWRSPELGARLYSTSVYLWTSEHQRFALVRVGFLE